MRKKRDFTEEDKKILKSNPGTIIWKLIFVPALLFEILVVATTVPSWGEYAVVFWIFTIPFIVIVYFAFRKQLFWSEEKQRYFIEKVKEQRAGRKIRLNRKNRQQTSPPYRATPYASNESLSGTNNNVKSPESISKPKELKKEVTLDKSVLRHEPEIPSLQGNYAKAVFLWAFRKPNPIRKQNEYSAYFLYECGIRDCVEYHKKLICEGYFTEAEPEEKLKLKGPLAHYQDTLYKLSVEGQKFLEENKAYAEIHKHKNWGVGWMEYDTYAKPGEDYLNVMRRIFNDKLKGASLQEQRSIYFCIYQLLREKGNMSDALETLLKVFYLDLSGIEGKDTYDLYKQGVFTKKEIKEYFSVCIMLAPGNINALKEYKSVYDPEMIEQLYTWKLPMNICNKDVFREIIESGINGLFDEDKAGKKLKTAFNKYVDEL